MLFISLTAPQAQRSFRCLSCHMYRKQAGCSTCSFFRWVAKRSSRDLWPSLAENQCQACSYRVHIDIMPFKIIFTLIIFTKHIKNKNEFIPTKWNISIFYLLSKCITLITSKRLIKINGKCPYIKKQFMQPSHSAM